LNNVKAVLFDVHGTLVYEDHPITEMELSDYLFSRGYEVSPHQVRAAWAYVAFIDYPRYRYKDWRSCFSRISGDSKPRLMKKR
jgi:FMN phosphatase YigB (HAD superfamily)